MRGDTTETSNLDRILQQIQIQNSNPSSLPPSDMSTRTDIGLLQPQKEKSLPWWSSDHPFWKGPLPGGPIISQKEAEYLLSELRADMTPVEGPYRSGKRSVQESAKAEGLLSQGKYLEALPHGIWAGVEALDTALSAPWLLGGILSTPFDLARAGKNAFDLARAGKIPTEQVVPVSPDEVPKLMNKIPVLNPQDLVDKKIFQIPADLTDAGVVYRGIDASLLPKGEPLLGGPGFVDLESSLNSNVVWAVSDRGVSGLPEKIANSDYAVIVAMSPEAHKSNTSIVNSMLGNMDAYVRDGRIGKRNLQRLNKLIKKKTGDSAHKDLQNFPGFGSENYRDFVAGLSFEARARIAEQLRSSAGQELGAPNITKILRKTQDPTTYGLGRSDALLLIEIDKGPNNIVNLGEHPGTVPHPSYKKGFKGKVVGKFATPVSYDTLFPDYVSARLKEGSTMANIERASNLEQPIATITQDIANTLPTQPYQYIQSQRQVQLALEAERGEWLSSGVTKKAGGVSPVDFENAIKNSDASSTLTPFTKEDVKQGAKDGSFQVFQLGQAKFDSKGTGLGGTSQVFFGIKKTNYADEYGFNHPELGPGERAVVGVVNNEPGAKGVAAPGVMGKAIEEGATALDAFAVPSQKYPSGFLPEVYNDYGFVEVGRVPFEEKYYSATQLKDLKE